MRSIYIMLTRSETVLSKLVHFVTKDTYTHASLSFDSDLATFYSSSRKNGRTMFPAGPCRETLRSAYYQRHDHIPCVVYELHVSDEAYASAKREVAAIMAEADRYHFNIIGLLLCRMGIPYHRKHYFFCSQFVSEILQRSRALELPKDTSLMRPIDCAHLPGLLCRFQGYLHELTSPAPLPV